jgi:AcrR family transcriptional regulator
MSLYRHVPGRDELLLAMIDTATGELALPPRHSGRWRGDLERAARLMWVVFQRHPWLAGSLSLTRPQPLPNPAMLSEWTMSALDRTRLCLQDKMFVQILLFTFVRGVASGLEPEAEAVRETGLTNDQWMETQLATFDAVLQAHPMPHFRALVDEDFDFTLDRLFEFGLARLLDGLTPWIAAHS